MIVALTLIKNTTKNNALKRNWKHYSKERLLAGLSPCTDQLVRLSHELPAVQDYWNVLENNVVQIVDEIAPLFAPKPNLNKQGINPVIKNLINKRKRFIRIDKIRATNANAPKIKTLGFEIRQLFENELYSCKGNTIRVQ